MLRKYTHKHNFLNLCILNCELNRHINLCIVCVHINICECVCICVCVNNLNKSNSSEWPNFSEMLKNNNSFREKIIKILQFFIQSLTDKCILIHSKYLENSVFLHPDCLNMTSVPRIISPNLNSQLF